MTAFLLFQLFFIIVDMQCCFLLYQVIVTATNQGWDTPLCIFAIAFAAGVLSQTALIGYQLLPFIL